MFANISQFGLPIDRRDAISVHDAIFPFGGQIVLIARILWEENVERCNIIDEII